jgi:hypothetical protein
MNTAISKAWIWSLMIVFLSAWSVPTALASSVRASFALFNEPGGDTSVQCDVALSPFTMHITMTNRGDLGGTDGFVRVTYRDGDFVDYAIPANTTLQISLIGGTTSRVDNVIKVSGDGTGGSVLIGQVSALADLGRTTCCTSPQCPPPF